MPSNALMETVVLGDLHGRRDLLEKALRDLGLIDEAGHWSGGIRQLVLMGDVIDRGPEPLGALDLLLQLQTEAAASGGRVTCLLGNHEFMAVRAAAGDHAYRMWWTYNGAGANYQEWLRREGLEGDERDLPYPAPFYALFSAAGRYGRWIRTWPVAVRLGDYVAVHGGWPPAGPAVLEEANAAYAGADDAYLAALSGAMLPFEEALWARHQPAEEIDSACARLGCCGLIIGHTPVAGITLSHGGRLIQVDTGMLRTSVWTALGIDDQGGLWALMDGAEPIRLGADGIVPLPDRPAEKAEAQPEPPLYGPGALIRLYRAPDGAWSRYLLIRGLAQFYGYPAYQGHFLTGEDGRWSTQPMTWPTARVDYFGCPADPCEVPDEVVERALRA